MKVVKMTIQEMKSYCYEIGSEKTRLFTSMKKAKDSAETYIELLDDYEEDSIKIIAEEMYVKDDEFIPVEYHVLFEGSNFRKKSERDSSSNNEMLERLAKLKEQIELNK